MLCSATDDVTALNAAPAPTPVVRRGRPGSSCTTATWPGSGLDSPAATPACGTRVPVGFTTATPGESFPHADGRSPCGTSTTGQGPARPSTSLVELAYAVTAHRVQGMTTDTAHALVTPEMTREALYVAHPRPGEDHLVRSTEDALDVTCHENPTPPPSRTCSVRARPNRCRDLGTRLFAPRSEAESLRTWSSATTTPETSRRSGPAARARTPGGRRGAFWRTPHPGSSPGCGVGGRPRGQSTRCPCGLISTLWTMCAPQRFSHPHRGLPESLGIPDDPYGLRSWLAPPTSGIPAGCPTYAARRADPRPREDLGSLARLPRPLRITDDDPACSVPPSPEAAASCLPRRGSRQVHPRTPSPGRHRLRDAVLPCLRREDLA